MAILKSLVRKEGGCANVKRYLERKNRSLAVDTNGVADAGNWDVEFDTMRRILDKDRGRKYYHFVISPDPEDGATLDQVRRLARTWAQARYPDGQWVIEYHDDGRNGGIHAHVVLNSVVPATGLKVHIDSDDVRGDALLLQVLCRSAGLSYFADAAGNLDPGTKNATVVHPEGRVPAPKSGRASARWKDEIRAMVDEALEATGTWEAFRGYLVACGYDATATSRGVTFTHPHTFGEGGPHFKVRATKDNLGEDYTFEAVAARLFAKGAMDRMPAPVAPCADPEAAGDVRRCHENAAVRKSAWELALEREGKRSWKQEVRDAVDECRARAKSMDEFSSLMEQMGFGVALTRRGITYTHPDVRPKTGEHLKVRGTDSALGSAYTRASVLASVLANAEHPYDGVLPTAGIPVRVPPRGLAARMSRLQDRHGRWDAGSVRRAVSVAARHGLGSRDEMEQAMERMHAEAARLDAELTELAARAYAIGEVRDAYGRLEEVERSISAGDISADLAAERDTCVSRISRYGFPVTGGAGDLEAERGRVEARLADVRGRADALRREADEVGRAADVVEAMGLALHTEPVRRARNEAVSAIMSDASMTTEERIAAFRKWRDLPFEGDMARRRLAQAPSAALMAEQRVRDRRQGRARRAAEVWEAPGTRQGWNDAALGRAATPCGAGADPHDVYEAARREAEARQERETHVRR